MLPSTFRQELKKEDDMKRQLKARIEVAKFLQDTMETMGMEIEKKNKCATAAEFVSFMKRVRAGDASVTNAEIARFAGLFNDDITLDNVGRHQLVNLCKLLGIPAFGSDTMLKYQLMQEIRDALEHRGMRATGLSEEGYRKDLKAWLDLSNKALPTSLLLMSRALKLAVQRPSELPGGAAPSASTDALGLAEAEAEALKQTLQGMPEAAVLSAEAQAVQADPVVEARKRLEELKREEERIEEERQEMLDADIRSAVTRFLKGAPQQLLSEPDDAVLSSVKTIMQAKFPSVSFKDDHFRDILVDEIMQYRADQTASNVTKESLSSISSTSSQSVETASRASATPVSMSASTGSGGPAEKEAVARAPSCEAYPKSTGVSPVSGGVQVPGREAAGVKETKSGGEIVDELKADEVGHIAEVVAMLSNKESATADEREEIEDLKQDHAEATNLIKTAKDGVPSSSVRLGGAVAKLLEKLEKDVGLVDAKIGTRLNLLDKDGDGIISESELREVVGRVLQSKLDDNQIAALMRKLDADGDGKILVHEVAMLAQIAEREKEEMIEDEDTHKELKKGRDFLNVPADQLTEEQAALYGALIEEYRDKIREVKELRTAKEKQHSNPSNVPATTSNTKLSAQSPSSNEA